MTLHSRKLFLRRTKRLRAFPTPLSRTQDSLSLTLARRLSAMWRTRHPTHQRHQASSPRLPTLQRQSSGTSSLPDRMSPSPSRLK
jgi:hypothetical protein